MKAISAILLIVFAASLFLVNISLGVFGTTEFFTIPFFSSQGDAQEESVLDSLTQRLDEGRQNLSIQELQKKITAPAPIKVFQNTSVGVLSRNEVFLATNAQRQQHGLASFVQNEILHNIAAAKAQDMFAFQYFEHESPTGVLFTDLADVHGYEYIAMGENLALGDYRNEAALVQAWMDSPGHRANILHEKYTEIGIAVEKGNFEGQEVWMAVQTFGLGLAACPAPDTILKSEIEVKKLQIQELETLLDVTKEELDAMQPKRGKAYENKIQEFNSLVEQYNATVVQAQTLIAGYNTQVEAFNQCADG